jgi:hypothetical protein
MNKKIKLFAMAIATAAMLVSLYKPAMAQNANGPRNSGGVVFNWYTSNTLAFQALLLHNIDIFAPCLSWSQLATVDPRPDIQKGDAGLDDMWELDINNNETIATYPGVLSATALPQVRKAIACVIDKQTAIIANILHYYGLQIDAPVAATQTTGWVDPAVVGANYPYKQNYTKAVDYLAAAGFWGDGWWLHYPNNTALWGAEAGASTQAYPLVVVIRNDNDIILAVGQYICTQLDGEDIGPTRSVFYANPEWAIWGAAHGEPNLQGGAFATTDHACEGPNSYTTPKVMGNRDYQLYTGGWTLGMFPTYDFHFYSTMFCFPYGANYVTGDTWAIGNPNYTEQMDPLLHDIYYAPTLSDSQGNCSLFTNFFVTNCVTIPLWTTDEWYAWLEGLEGVVKARNGIVNDYTFLNAYKAGGGPIIVGEPYPWILLNQLYSWATQELDFLDTSVDQNTLSTNPYSRVYQPWMMQDWQVGVWTDGRTGGNTNTNVTYWFRQDIGCAEPVTGTFAGFFTAEDFASNMWYTYAYPSSFWWINAMDINHIIINNNYEATVYFNIYNPTFALYEPTYPMMMPTTVLTSDTQLCRIRTVQFHGYNLNTPAGAVAGYTEYAFTTDSVVSVISATQNTNTIYEGQNFYITGYGQPLGERGTFVPITSFAPSDTITITYYYANPTPPSTTYLGSAMVGTSGVPATMYSYGYLYPVTINPYSTPITATLYPNPWFFMQTPLLGELDWLWYWVGSNKPRSGYYRIDILDVVLCTSHYCQRGNGVHNPMYFPAADMCAADPCHIGILDVVTITGKYGHTFGTPAPYTVGANSVQSYPNVALRVTWPGLMGSNWGPPPISYGLVFTPPNSGVAQAALSPGSTFGWAIYPGKAVCYVDSRNPTIYTATGTLSYEVLAAAGATTSDATCWWPSLLGGTSLTYYTYNENLKSMSTSSGLVDVAPLTGTPNFAFGSWSTPSQAFWISVSS